MHIMIPHVTSRLVLSSRDEYNVILSQLLLCGSLDIQEIRELVEHTGASSKCSKKDLGRQGRPYKRAYHERHQFDFPVSMVGALFLLATFCAIQFPTSHVCYLNYLDREDEREALTVLQVP